MFEREREIERVYTDSDIWNFLKLSVTSMTLFRKKKGKMSREVYKLISFL